MTILKALTDFVDALGFESNEVMEIHLNGHDTALTVITRSYDDDNQRVLSVNKVQYKGVE